ncbi:Uncharacterized protein YpuA, DUF1002 family [Edaphobacillus lindanitolerans]|uniref:Uncharacterized protein YpuA, DUF1002 family n=2 Tax=Edaphobacillus lindanitolerans TaxID=550447 RepID=A0A1U7PSK7_9BACI|nr:DUF1002 domain-containing protein [Edaphobacillus lindanitolerans]SIT89415.1 Uncharacterized protein YpuA, DUF1002 family [Edaphobacillus lindanitolerans]
MLTAPVASADTPVDERLGVPIVVYGANLSDAEKASVKESLDVDDNAETEEITVSGEDLGKYIKDSNPRARMYSSAKITVTDEGSGLVIQIVTPENITQVTSDMYANAMLTAGIEDANVDVAAPKPVTGHSALAGIYKAYEASGGTLDTERTDVANDELSVATDLTEKSGVDEQKVNELLTELKQQIAEQKPASKEEVEKIVKEQLDKLQIELSPEDRQLLIDLMDRIRQLDIDFGKWSDKLNQFGQELNDKYGDKIKETINDEGFWQSVKDFFNTLIDKAKSFFS